MSAFEDRFKDRGARFEKARTRFEKGVALFAAFADRVTRLEPESWDRLSTRCAALNGPEFSALVARSKLAATPYKLPARGEHDRGLAGVIGGVAAAWTRTLFIAGELTMEFEVPGTRPPLQRKHSSGRPATDSYVDATFLIENTLAPRQHAQPGVTAVVRAAGHAVLRHHWLSPDEFAAVYAYVEPDIPFAELQGGRSQNST